MKILLPPLLTLLLAPSAIEARQFPVKKVAPDPHRYIVRYKNNEGKTNVHTAADRVHADLEPQHAIAATLSSEACEGLRNNSNIEYVERDYPRYPIMMRGYDSNDLFKQHVRNNKKTHAEDHRKLTETVPYGVPMVQADQVSYDSSNPRTICIIDSGYDFGHEDLPSTNVDGFSFDNLTFPWNKDGFDSHGTHVAGTVAAISSNGEGVIGVAPGVNLFIIRLFADDDSVILGSDLVVAANRCKAAGANVINMSLGGGGFSLAESTAFADLFTNDNILSIAAAGNDGDTPEGTELSYPASYGSVVSVAALDSNKTVASFSQRNNQVDIAAPGVAVLSTISMGKGVSGGTLDVSGVSYNGLPMTGSATGSVSGFLVDCGLGVDDCTAASGQICLISRGEILFSDKVLACQNGGGLGAVIYNNAAGDLFGVLGGVDTQIPSIGISDIAGEFLMANFLARRARFEVGVSNYAPFDGTSMACPHVAAVAALIWSHDPTKTAGEVRAALESTAEDLGIPGKDNEYGYGLVQAVAACSALTGSSCTSEASAGPSSEPTAGPSSKPSSAPTAGPSSGPSSEPTAGPSAGPSQGPSSGPTLSSSPPSGSPSEESSLAPTLSSSPPSGSPSEESSLAPSVSSSSPSAASLEPSAVPREVSSLEQPTVAPSRRASMGSSSSSASPPNLHFYSWIAAPSLLVLALFFAA